MEYEILNKIQFQKTQSIREVMDRFNETAVFTNKSGFGIIVDEHKKCIGVVTDGDIRRQLLLGVTLDMPVEKVTNTNFIYSHPNDSNHQILRLFDKRVRVIPVIDDNGNLVDLLNFSDFTAAARLEKNIIRSRAPVRLSFAGGGTDMSFYFNQKQGFVLSSTINKYSYSSITVRYDNKIRIVSKDYNLEAITDYNRLFEYGDSLDLIKACVNIMEPGFGFDLETFSEVEPGTGLGGSSAISAAVLGALNHFRSESRLDKYTLADLAYQAERVELGIAGGWQDQYASVFGGLNLIEFRKNEILVYPLRILDDILLELHYNLLLFRFGESRQSGIIINDIKKNYKSSSELMDPKYKHLANLALEMKDVLLKGQLNKFGEFLHVGWELKKSFSNRISDSYIDDLYATARNAGAIGGKVLGAGGGGYLLIFCNPSNQPFVIESLEAKGSKLENFDFIETGLQTWSAKNHLMNK